MCAHTHACTPAHMHSFSISLLRGSRELCILVIVNTATTKMITNPSGVLTSSPLDIYSEVGQAEHMVDLVLVFEGIHTITHYS